MPYSVYRGTVEAANKLDVSTGPTLYKQDDPNDFWDDRFHSRSPKSDKYKHTSAIATLYLNEPGGRDVTVIYTPPKDRASAKAARRIKTSLRQQHKIQVRPDNDNLWRGPASSRRLTPDFEATLPKGWQSGKRKLTFTVSKCSPDRFVVTYRYFYAKQWWASHLIVEVRKRLQCHLYEMRAGSTARAGDTIDVYRPLIKRCQRIFAASFGIDLVFDDDKIEPEGEFPYHVTRNQNQLTNMLPTNRGPRDLYIAVVNSFAGNAVGWGGNGIAGVEHATFRQTRLQLERVKKALDSGGSVGADPYWQQVANWMQDEPSVATVDFLDQHARTVTLAHEIGHALGLVPQNEEAGGMTRTGWSDPTEPGHCARTRCAMYHSAELGQLPIAKSLSAPLFDHYNALSDFGEPDGCNLYLRTTLLDDIR
jgi:hypothetical protein